MIKGIKDTKGIPGGKLEHIFLGTVKGERISGYHCDEKMGDERVYAEARLYPKSKRIITYNRGQKLFEAYVRDKKSKTLKTDNAGKSTFFNAEWTRQDIVNCIDRIGKSGKILKAYDKLKITSKTGKSKNINQKYVYYDSETGMYFVNCPATAYPLLKY